MNARHEIAVIEDNAVMRLGMTESLRREGFRVHEFSDGPSALDFFKKQTVHLVITDLKMEPVSGMELLQTIKSAHPATEVMVVSAFGTVEAAVEAMRLGAVDFMTKPFPSEELRIRVGKVIEKIQRDQTVARLTEENLLLQDELASNYQEMIGASESMQNLSALIRRVATENSSVLIEGESGTGKELVARALHYNSPRKERPFIKVNCGALNDGLLESELFGHEKGAFTGAIKRKKGRFELADGGTLFLDEIGDVSPAMQVKLLRVLQEKEFERVGGEETIGVDVRIIAATHRPLARWVAEEKFREDLYYRLRVIPIHLPPLRERKKDLPALVDHFIRKLSQSKGESQKTIPPAGMELLMNYSWPGNIRELENLVERLCVISTGKEIDPQLIAQHVSGNHKPFHAGLDNLPLEEAVEAFEKNLVLQALKKTNNVKNQAAKLLGIRTSTLYYKMEKFGLL
ncbi:sigma-54 dependent transcriptional regulator [bacterium]|nr:sigma-54 dependent transcriptional regulator [bacterium]